MKGRDKSRVLLKISHISVNCFLLTNKIFKYDEYLEDD